MPSFDVVNRVDLQEIDNVINNTRKAIIARYDFRGSKTDIQYDRKGKKITLLAEDKMKLEAVTEMLRANAARRGVSQKSLKFGDELRVSGKQRDDLQAVQFIPLLFLEHKASSHDNLPAVPPPQDRSDGDEILNESFVVPT